MIDRVRHDPFVITDRVVALRDCYRLKKKMMKSNEPVQSGQYDGYYRESNYW